MSYVFKTPEQRKAEQRAELLKKKEEEKQRKIEEKKQKLQFVKWCVLAVIGNGLLAGMVFATLYFTQKP